MVHKYPTVMGLHIQLDKSSSTCVDFGFGRLSGFFGDLNFSVPSRIWYLLVSLAIQNLERNLGDRISYSIREHLKTFRKSQAISRESAGNSDPGTC